MIEKLHKKNNTKSSIELKPYTKVLGHNFNNLIYLLIEYYMFDLSLTKRSLLLK